MRPVTAFFKAWQYLSLPLMTAHYVVMIGQYGFDEESHFALFALLLIFPGIVWLVVQLIEWLGTEDGTTHRTTREDEE